MADPTFPPFCITPHAGQNSNPKVPDGVFTTYLKGKKNELMNLKLTSDAFNKTWEVELNGRRLAGGWEDFSAAHCLRDDEVLVFSHVGDMVFHVTPCGRSFSQTQRISSSYGDSEGNSDSDEDDDSEDDDSEDDDSDFKSISSKNKPRIRTESLSENSCLLTVTSSSLRRNRVSITKRFAKTNGLDKRCCEIETRDVVDKRCWTWVLGLRHNSVTGQSYISERWRNFCLANKLKTGSCYRFKLVKNGTRPLLQLCSEIILEGNSSKPHGKSNVSEKSSSSDSTDDDDDSDRDSEADDDSDSKTKSRFKTDSSSSGKECLLAATPSNLGLNRVKLTKAFTRTNGLNKRCGKIDLLNPSGESWTLSLRYYASSGQACIRGGWKSFCRENKLKTGSLYRFNLI